MLTPLRISTLCVALTAVLSTTLLAADSVPSTDDGETQTISASADTRSNKSDQTAPTDELLVVGDLAGNSGSTRNGVNVGGETPADAITMQDSVQDSTEQGSADQSSMTATGDSEAGSDDSSTTDTPAPATGTEPAGPNSQTAKNPVSSPTPSASSPSDTSSNTDSQSTEKTQVTTKSTTSQQSDKPTQTSTTALPSTTAAPATTSPPAQASKYESMRNSNDKFGRFANTPSNQLNVDSLMEPVSPVDYGGNGTGQFRIACEYSHFNYDDPIVYPGQPGKSHFHMYFGNTRTDANTTKNSLVNSGGGSCNGFELNRSSYWTPAVLDGKGNAIVPDHIIIYYKTKKPNEVQAMPQGLQIIGGNANGQDFSPKETLFWSCGSSGHSYNHTNRIPSCGGDQINATIAFPQCWDGKNLTSSDFSSHMKEISESSSCPSSHPVRLPQLTYLLYYPPGNSSTWYLSSDRSGGFNTGPGATLHADWMGGWHDATMNLWIDTCVRRGRNCSFGQTGTPKKLAALNPLQAFTGNNTIPIPR